MQDYSKDAASSVLHDAASTFGFGDVLENIESTRDPPEANGKDGQQKDEPENEDTTLQLEAGIEITLPVRCDTVRTDGDKRRGMDGGRGWGITAAAFFILATISTHSVNQQKILTIMSSATDVTTSTCESTDLQHWNHLYVLATFPTCLKYSGFESMVTGIVNTTHSQCLPNIVLEMEVMLFEGVSDSDIRQCEHEIVVHNQKRCCGHVFTSQATTTSTSDFSQVADVYSNVFGLFGIISAVLILRFDYRVVAVVGGVVTAVGCLAASFVSNNVRLFSFLYGALPGIGYNFLSVSSTVALLEYFNTRRLTALIWAQLGPILCSMLYPLIQKFLFDFMTSSQNILLFETGSGVLAALIGASLRPLRLRMKDNSGGTMISRMFGIDGLGLFKEPLLYVMAFLFFFWKGAHDIPYVKLQEFKEELLIFTVGQLLLILAYAGNLIGTFFGCCLPREMKLRTVMLILGTLSVITGALCMAASQLHDLIFAIVYSGMFGVFTGVGIPCLQYAIPTAFGEDNIVLSVGIMEFSFGLATIAIIPLANAVQSSMGKVDACFYLCGAMFLVSSGLAGLSICVHQRKKQIDKLVQESVELNKKQKTESTVNQNSETELAQYTQDHQFKYSSYKKPDTAKIEIKF